MPQSPLRLAIILGSIREGRLCPRVAGWFAREAARSDRFEIDVVDLADTELPPALCPVPPAQVVELSTRLAAADAFVIVTPEYNHSFPAPLKTLIDWNYTAWQAKPVGFVSYGGIAGGLRAVEQLRLVLAELHAATIRDTVSFHNASDRFDDSGSPREPAGCTAAAKIMIDQLAWWGEALRQARRERPYRG